MQTMRKEWIDEGKPRETIEDASTSASKNPTEASRTSKPDEAPVPINLPDQPQTPAADGANDDDLYSATPRRSSNLPQKGSAPTDGLFVSDDESGDHSPEDDLDLLLAEDSMHDPGIRTKFKDHHEFKGINGNKEDSFDDEMEAMAAVDDM